MSYIWDQIRGAIPLITHGNPYLMNLLWVSVRVAVISTSAALVVGLPLGLALGLGRFRGRRALQILANASLALPSVVVGIGLVLLLLPQGAFGSLRIEFTLPAVYIAQALLALPYIVALTPAAIQGLPPGLLAQARALGAGRVQLSLLALREAKIALLAAVIAAAGATIAEVGAVVIVGGNFEGRDQTLASGLMDQFNYSGQQPLATAIAIMMVVVILVMAGVLTVIQQRTGGIQMRFRTA
ncbi:MAG TPA: ABC transporter permease [Solirubrobacteraceae bacterium]|nr:ABC transporter permease [Solirubrobacteraceae bacterium]